MPKKSTFYLLTSRTHWVLAGPLHNGWYDEFSTAGADCRIKEEKVHDHWDESLYNVKHYTDHQVAISQHTGTSDRNPGDAVSSTFKETVAFTIPTTVRKLYPLRTNRKQQQLYNQKNRSGIKGTKICCISNRSASLQDVSPSDHHTNLYKEKKSVIQKDIKRAKKHIAPSFQTQKKYSLRKLRRKHDDSSPHPTQSDENSLSDIFTRHHQLSNIYKGPSTTSKETSKGGSCGNLNMNFNTDTGISPKRNSDYYEKVYTEGSSKRYMSSSLSTNGKSMNMVENRSRLEENQDGNPLSPESHTDHFVCDVCAAQFSDRYHLDRHMLIHGGEKKHVCYKCDQAFSRKDNLRRHILTHSSLKPFQCTICCARFIRKGHLHNHILGHSGTKQYECQLCDKKYSRRYALNIHIRVHHEGWERPRLVCGHKKCKKTFAYGSHLKRHQRNLHGLL